MRVRLLQQGDPTLMTHELNRMGRPAPGDMMDHPAQPFACKITAIPHALATGVTAWLQRHERIAWWHSVPGRAAETIDLLVSGTRALPTTLCDDAQHHPELRPLAAVLQQALQHGQNAPTHLHLRDTVLDLRQRTLVMGILNVTPDSFSDGGLYLQPEQAIKHAEEMLSQGADIIDVGGASSRPGATPVSAAVESERVIPVVRELVRRFDAHLSVDTYRASVAKAAVDAGAVMINDISALRIDPAMAPLLAAGEAAVVLMHMQGTPQTMQRSPTYHHVIDDIYGFLAERVEYAMQSGIARQRIVCDPGFGFGKTLQHNVELLHGLQHFQALGQPIMVGTSRKSFLGRLLQRDVWDRLEGTIASVLYAMLRGAAIVRVHDVGPVVQAVRLVNAVAKGSGGPSEITP
jgi:dihydropteroate synthase